MFGRKTRDLIVETATIAKGLKKDFKAHEDGEEVKFDKLYTFVDEKIESVHTVVRECHETCPETERFNDHVKVQNGTLLRIEKKHDEYYLIAKTSTKKLKESMDKRQDDYLKSLAGVKDEVKAIREAKKTTRQVWADIGKVVGYICLICGLFFGIMRYYDSKKAAETKKIETLLEKLVDKATEG